MGYRLHFSCWEWLDDKPPSRLYCQAWVTLEETQQHRDGDDSGSGTDAAPPGLAAALRSELSAVVACGGSGLGLEAVEAEARQLRAIARQAQTTLAAQAQVQTAASSATSSPAAAVAAALGSPAARGSPSAAASPPADGLPAFAVEAAAACDAIDASVARTKAAYASLLAHFAMTPGAPGGCPAAYASLSGEAGGLLRDLAGFVRDVAATEAKIRDRLARAARLSKQQQQQQAAAAAPAAAGQPQPPQQDGAAAAPALGTHVRKGSAGAGVAAARDAPLSTSASGQAHCATAAAAVAKSVLLPPDGIPQTEN